MTKYKHKEAFCLMWYGCKCGHRELIWNSRDGVTPFSLDCPSCGQPDLMHIDFNRDKFAPNHVLNTRQRYWRDGTMEDALRAIDNMRTQVNARFKDHPELLAKYQAIFDKREQEIRDDECYDFQLGWPYLDTQP